MGENKHCRFESVGSRLNVGLPVNQIANYIATLFFCFSQRKSTKLGERNEDLCALDTET